MKTMRWMGVATLVAGLWVPSLSAQQGPQQRRGPREGRGLPEMVTQALAHKDSLQLTAAQVQRLQALQGDLQRQVLPLRQQMTEQMQRAREDRTASRDSLRALAQKLRAAQEPLGRTFRETLTVEQMMRLQRFMAPQGSGRPGMRSPRRGGPGMGFAPGRPGMGSRMRGAPGMGFRMRGAPGMGFRMWGAPGGGFRGAPGAFRGRPMMPRWWVAPGQRGPGRAAPGEGPGPGGQAPGPEGQAPGATPRPDAPPAGGH